ncbi:MAG: hypothetical protein WD468_00935 [Pirellulales bacterium]
MAIRSVNDRRYSRRFLIMGAAICGFSLWSLYDGYIKYPREQARGLKFDELTSEGRQNEWDEFAISQGWSNSIPHEPKSQEDFATSIYMQYAMAILTAVIGLPMLLMVLKSRGNWIESTDSGINTSWGESFNFDQVLRVDKKRWQKKGIAKVTYQDGNRQRRFVADDFKYERPTMDRILFELEQRIDPDRIVNGPPELPPGAADDVAIEPTDSEQIWSDQQSAPSIHDAPRRD